LSFRHLRLLTPGLCTRLMYVLHLNMFRDIIRSHLSLQPIPPPEAGLTRTQLALVITFSIIGGLVRSFASTPGPSYSVPD
jgi:hypothetical protein